MPLKTINFRSIIKAATFCCLFLASAVHAQEIIPDEEAPSIKSKDSTVNTTRIKADGVGAVVGGAVL